MFKYKVCFNFGGFSISVRHFCNRVAMKYLNVAEKNDAAKNIAAILSRGNSARVM